MSVSTTVAAAGTVVSLDLDLFIMSLLHDKSKGNAVASIAVKRRRFFKCIRLVVWLGK